MDFHPELKIALQFLLQTWPWIAGGLIALLLSSWIIWILWPTPFEHTSLREAQDTYTAKTVRLRHVYSIWHNNRRQEFAVLTILDSGWFRIGVYPMEATLSIDKHRFSLKNWIKKISPWKSRFVFTGWVTIIPAQAGFITPTTVANHLQGSAHYDQYLQRLTKGIN